MVSKVKCFPLYISSYLLVDIFVLVDSGQCFHILAWWEQYRLIPIWFCMAGEDYKVLREVTWQKYCQTRKVIFYIPDDKLKLKTIVKDIRRMTRDTVMINLLRKVKISECFEYYFLAKYK